MPLDVIYTLPPERPAELHDRAQVKFARREAMSPEERKASDERQLAEIDALPPEWRALVHEFGWIRIKRARGER